MQVLFSVEFIMIIVLTLEGGHHALLDFISGLNLHDLTCTLWISSWFVNRLKWRDQNACISSRIDLESRSISSISRSTCKVVHCGSRVSQRGCQPIILPMYYVGCLFVYAADPVNLKYVCMCYLMCYHQCCLFRTFSYTVVDNTVKLRREDY